MNEYVAVDLGAESGRVIVGNVSRVDVVHRFATGPVRLGNSIFWDFPAIFAEIKKGLSAAFARSGSKIRSIGIDTWGVDYALLDRDGDLIGNPYHYRDSRTDGVPEEVFAVVPLEEVYAETGIQVMQLNTIYQLFAHLKAKPSLVGEARYLLTVPALLNFWLTGVMKNEYTHATTTQLFNPARRQWSTMLLDRLGLDREMFVETVMPGTTLGPLLPHLAREVGAPSSVSVVATACHDTASAVAAVPSGETADYAYLSSGTWSLLGIESPTPIITEKSRLFNFTNEGAADGGVRFLKNIMGLWILQECKRCWDEEGGPASYDELTEVAEQNGPADFVMDVDESRFLKPGIIDDTMPQRIQAYCRETDQRVPSEKGEIVRGVLESLAKKYVDTIRMIEEITGRGITQLNIVGGGSKNRFLCRLAADATGIPVYAGPSEATAIGNIVVQAVAAGELADIAEGRRIIRESYGIEEFMPA